MKAGASVKGMELTLEGSTLREVLDTCDEATSFTSPMVCKRKEEEPVRSDKAQHCLSCLAWWCGFDGM
jgi:hypothetical protein